MRGSNFESMPIETASERSASSNNRRLIPFTMIVCALSILLMLGIAFVTMLDTDQKPSLRPSQINKPNQPGQKQQQQQQQEEALSNNKNGSVQPNDESMDSIHGLSIAWLMSFPNSGTSFTSKLVRHLTLASTASNYGHEVLSTDSVISMFDNEAPPFWIDPHSLDAWTRPTSLVLTKTHCGGRCEMCGPSDYVENPHSFLTQCLSGRKANEPTSQYSVELVKKAVHLIRNPFDNVVSRFHLERKLFSDRGLQHFASDRAGFLAFCKRLDDVYGAEEQRLRWIDPQVYEWIHVVPCYADFVRYIQWHNLAFVVTQDKNIPTFVLHYENFEGKFDETVDELMEFLETPRRGEKIEFILGKEYLDYFTPEERDAIRKGLQRMALTPTWDNIKHYFV